MVAAGGRDDPRFRRAPRQQIGKGAARLERAGVLQEFELQHKRLAGDAEIAGIDPDDRRVPDVGADQPLGRRDPGSVDAAFSRVSAQNCTLPSEGGACRTGGGRRCTAGRGTLGDGNG